MQNIQIDRKLKEKWNQAVLGCIQCSVEVTDSPKELLDEIEEVSQQLISSMQIEDIKSREHIAQTSACCKALGKDVKRYRNSAEAMNRRILQGKGLYHINNVVEVNNLISVKTGYSLGTYDLDCLQGEICWTVTGEGIHYQGIGKEAVNIEFLPVLQDDLGYFGNPNSDNTRAMITERTKKILLCVYGFGGRADLDAVLCDAKRALECYCSAKDIEISVIE